MGGLEYLGQGGAIVLAFCVLLLYDVGSDTLNQQ